MTNTEIKIKIKLNGNTTKQLIKMTNEKENWNKCLFKIPIKSYNNNKI